MKLCVPIAPSLKALCNTNTSPPTAGLHWNRRRGSAPAAASRSSLRFHQVFLEITDRLQSFSSCPCCPSTGQGSETPQVRLTSIKERNLEGLPFRLNSQLPFHRFISFPQARRFTRCPSSRGAGEMGLCEARLLPCTWPRWHLAAERAHCQPAAGGFICMT